MLTSLSIQNYVLIQELNIELSGGLTIVTGETGAGKSILLGALALLIGQRADTGVLLDESRKCFVEGTFAIKGYNLEDVFERNDLDFDDNTVVRREINPDGKSRAFVNDTPVNLTILKELGERLIDIHSQHQTLYLENPAFQLRILDTFAQQAPTLTAYSEVLGEYRTLKSKYQKIENDAKANALNLDFFKHQHEQLQKANLKDDEQAPLEEELQTMTHAEEIKLALNVVSAYTSGDENSIISQLKDVNVQLAKIRSIYHPATEFFDRIETVLIEMKDIAQDITNRSEHIEYDPERIEFLKSRVDLIYSLQQKHKVTSIAELITLREDFQQKIDSISNVDFQLEELKIEIDKKRAQLKNIAEIITDNRKRTIPTIENRVQELLRQLGMPNAMFKIELTTTDDFATTGTDKVRFLFTANNQTPLQDLGKVASGGEMARFMLSIKAAISEVVVLPTIIFDEIDTGVSGDIADKMGNVIVAMSKDAQVINITHLPQIASKGQNHFMVYKHDLGKTTQTQMKHLKSDERVIEIARMLSGEKLSEAAINNAKALLGVS